VNQTPPAVPDLEGEGIELNDHPQTSALQNGFCTIGDRHPGVVAAPGGGVVNSE